MLYRIKGATARFRGRLRARFSGEGSDVAFDGFVSYSHAADGRLAPALQRAMQRLAKPWYRSRALHVFRDEAALSANPHLWSSIQTALDESAWFVLLASPDSAASEWVDRELTHWLGTKSADRILVVVTDGTWQWDSTTDTLTGTAVPTALRTVFDDEPRHLDLRWAHSETDLDMHHARFRDAVAQLAAPLHGIAKDELDSEDVRQHRRTRRLARGGASTLALLVVVSLVFGLVAYTERNKATAQKRRAEQQTVVADAGRLAGLAADHAPTQLDLALLLAVEGRRLHESIATRNGLLSALSQSPHLTLLRSRFGRDISAADTSPDGTRVAVGGLDGTLRIWDLQENKPLTRNLAAHKEPVFDVAFSPDGTKIATAGGDKTVRLWNAATGTPLGQPLRSEAPETLRRVVFSPDGRMVAAFGPATKLWDVPSGKPHGSLVNQIGLGALAFHPDGHTVAIGAERPYDSVVLTFDIDLRGVTSTPEGLFYGRSPTLEKPLQAIPVTRTVARGLSATALAFSPDGKSLAEGDADGTVQVVDARSGKRRWKFAGNADSVVDVQYGAEGRVIATASDGSVILWDAQTGARIGRLLTGPSNGIRHVHFTSGETDLIAVGTDGVASWSLDRQVLGTRALAGSDTVIASLAASGHTLATSGESLRLWDTRAMRAGPLLDRYGFDPDLDGSLRPGELSRVAVSADGSVVAEIRGADGGGVRLWDAARGRKLGEIDNFEIFPSSGHASGFGDGTSDGPWYIAFSPDGRQLAVSGQSSGAVKLVDVRTRRLTGIAFAPCLDEGVLTFSPDGRTVVTAGSGSCQPSVKIRFWDPKTGKEQAGARVLSTAVSDLSFSTDGRMFATAGGDGRVVLWDTKTRRAIGTPLVVGSKGVAHVAFAPDGATLAAISQDGVLTLWDVATHQPIGSPLIAHTDATSSINAIGFFSKPRLSPNLAYLDSDTLVTSSVDGSVTFWDLRPQSWERTACRLAGRNLTKDEWRQYIGHGAYRQTCAQWPSGT